MAYYLSQASLYRSWLNNRGGSEPRSWAGALAGAVPGVPAGLWAGSCPPELLPEVCARGCRDGAPGLNPWVPSCCPGSVPLGAEMLPGVSARGCRDAARGLRQWIPQWPRDEPADGSPSEGCFAITALPVRSHRSPTPAL